MAVCVVPAAGSSIRMGRPKALLPWRDSTVVETLISTLLEGGVEKVVVVVQPGDSKLTALLRATSATATVVNPRPKDGMLSSILAGTREALDTTGEAPLLVCPVDHPLLSTDTVAQVLARQANASREILIPTFEGRRGHPVLIPKTFLDELRLLDPSRGLKHLLERHPGKVLEIPVADQGVVENLNTPEDYARARSASGAAT